MSNKTAYDFRVENHGTIWLFTPLTAEAKKFVRSNIGVEVWQWLGASFGVDHRMAYGLSAYLEECGFTIGK